MKIISHEKGFTLIETLVAIGVLSVAIGGLITVVAVSLRNLGIQKDKLLASRIAAEGIGFMISKRDNNLRCLNSGGSCNFLCGWKEDLLLVPPCPGINVSWEVSAARPDELRANRNFSIFNPTNYICLDGGGNDIGKFTYCNNNPTEMLPQQFTREVVVTDVAPNLLRVRSIVRWQSRYIGNQTLTLEEVLFGTD